MTWFIPITDTDDNTVCISTHKIRYIEDRNQERRIYCVSGNRFFFNTYLPLEQIVQQLAACDPPIILVGYVGDNGYDGAVNLTYISHVESNKNGNAEIHCHYSNNRHIIKSQTPINDFLQYMQQAGARFIDT